MATVMKKKQPQKKTGVVRQAPIPRAVREKVMRLLQENYSFMDSPTFRRKRVEEELLTEDAQRELPLTSWYQPTRDELGVVSSGSPPQLMKAPEERLMFLRFNYCKKRLLALQKQIQGGELTLAKAQEFACGKSIIIPSGTKVMIMESMGVVSFTYRVLVLATGQEAWVPSAAIVDIHAAGKEECE